MEVGAANGGRPGRLCSRPAAWASGPWVAVEAAERGDEADEARGVAWRSMVHGAFRGWVRIVRGGAGVRASQLIASVRLA